MTKPRFNHSVNLDAAQEERLQNILKKRNVTFAYLVKWAMDKVEEIIKKEG